MLPKNSFEEVDKLGIGSSISEKVFGIRLTIELCLDYFSEGLKKDPKSLFEDATGL